MSRPVPPSPAQEPAGRSATWDDLASRVRGCTLCAELAATRTQVVPGSHAAGADLLVVGEAPGAQEDVSGVPFVGKSGQLLDTVLAESGIERDRVAVANVLKCRPPANRAPRRPEVHNCRPWLVRQIELADPRVLISLGGTAAAWFLGPGTRLGEARLHEHDYAGRPLVVTYHPSAAIRFGPRGAPLAALREDLARAARLAGPR